MAQPDSRRIDKLVKDIRNNKLSNVERSKKIAELEGVVNASLSSSEKEFHFSLRNFNKQWAQAEEAFSLIGDMLDSHDVDNDEVEKIVSDVQNQVHQEELARLREQEFDNNMMRRLNELKKGLPEIKTVNEAELKSVSPASKQEELDAVLDTELDAELDIELDTELDTEFDTELDAELETEMELEEESESALMAELDASMPQDLSEIKPILNASTTKTVSPPPFIREASHFSSQQDTPSVAPEKTGFFSKLIKVVQNIVKAITEVIDFVFKPSEPKVPLVKTSAKENREEKESPVIPNIKHTVKPSEQNNNANGVWKNTRSCKSAQELSAVKDSLKRVVAETSNFRAIQQEYKARIAARKEALAAHREEKSKENGDFKPSGPK